MLSQMHSEMTDISSCWYGMSEGCQLVPPNSYFKQGNSVLVYMYMCILYHTLFEEKKKLWKKRKYKDHDVGSVLM